MSLRRLSTLLEAKLLSRKSSTQRLVIVHLVPQSPTSTSPIAGDACTQTEALSAGPPGSVGSPPSTPCSPPQHPNPDSTAPANTHLVQQEVGELRNDTCWSVTEAAELLAHTGPLIGDEWESDDGLESDDEL